MLDVLKLCSSHLKQLFDKLDLSKTRNPATPSFASMAISTQLRRVFDAIDSNGDGKLSPAELKQLLLNLGYEEIDAANEAEVMVKVLDYDGDGFVDLDEFMSVMDGYDDGDYIEVFRVFDVDGNGLISAEEVRRVLRRLGKKCSLKECKKMVQGVDRDGDGFVSLEEFKVMMKCGV